MILSICCFVLFLSGLTIVLCNKEKKKNTIYEMLTNVNNPIFSFIVDNIKENTTDLNNLCFYDYFKDMEMNIIIDRIRNKIEEEGYEWLRLPEVKDKDIDKYIDDIVKEILDIPEIDNMINNKFLNIINNNIGELSKVEEEAVKYNDTFGEDSNGELDLHPKEKTENIEENLFELSLEDLDDKGLVEEVE